jgi:chloride channel 3/4/5
MVSVFGVKGSYADSLDKATRTRHLSPNATCTFNALPGDTRDPNRLSLPDIVIGGRYPGRSPNLEQGRPSASEATEVDFGQYVDEVSPKHATFESEYVLTMQTALSVSPKMPLEIVMQLFRRMGLVFTFVVNSS